MTRTNLEDVVRLMRGAVVLAAGLVMSCGGDDEAPLSGNVEAWSDGYVYVLRPGDSVFSGVTLYNGTSNTIVQPSCTIDTPYPVAGQMVIADGVSILRQTPDQSWVVIDAGIPACADPNPAGDVTLEPGFHTTPNQAILVPTTPGRYSWVISYHELGSDVIKQVATPAVAVGAP